MRGATLQKQNTLMHKQLKSFETSLQQASNYYNADELYNLITPIIPHGVHIISFDGLKRIVGQSRLSKGGRKISSQPSLYFRAFLDDFLQYLDHLYQLKYNFDEKIYSALFEYYYEVVFEDVKTTRQNRQPFAKRNLLKVFDLPKYAKFRKSFSKEFVSEVAADCESLSGIMITLQMLVRKWGQLCDDGDIDINLFGPESEIDLGLYPNCDAFEAIFRYVPDILYKSKQAHQLAYDWWCLAEKIRKKLTGQWKPKKASKKKLEVPSRREDGGGASTASSRSWTSEGTTPATRQTSRTSVYHDHCTPAKKNNEWVHPTPNPSKLRRKDTFTYTPRARKKQSYIPRWVAKTNKETRVRKKGLHQTTQTQKKVKDACTSPMVPMADITTNEDDGPIRELSNSLQKENHEYSYSESEFDDDDEDDDNSLIEDDSKTGYDQHSTLLQKHEERRTEEADDRIEHLTFDIDEKVKQLEKETRKLEKSSHQETKTQKLSMQVERAIRDIESLQDGLQEIEIEKDKLKTNQQPTDKDSKKGDNLKENLEVLDNKLRNMAGLAKVNSYRQKLLASDMDLALELRGTFTRYNYEVKGKIELLEKLIQEERREQVRLEGEIRGMISNSKANSEEQLSLQSVTSSSRSEREQVKTPTVNEKETHPKSPLSDFGSDDEDDDDDWFDDLDKEEDIGKDGQREKGINDEDDQEEEPSLSSPGKSRAPHIFKQNSALSPLQEESSNHNSPASHNSLENSKKRVDSPSPKMYDSKREQVPKMNVDPVIKLPKISESGHMIQQA
ncbi:hypothetical protein BSL78_00631 [Apostichopus japonicus]|uniref:Uncharacterized protein n=1 Tax=Stichopus japonicus TaxID=307972 RepID=A0A2G8LQD2_STIJA|nr:hypothetical protein BSL78_00631 [Apostichopus japonicus]